MDRTEKMWGFSRTEHRRRIIEGQAKSAKLAAYKERHRLQGEVTRAAEAARRLGRALGPRPSAWERICAEKTP